MVVKQQRNEMVLISVDDLGNLIDTRVREAMREQYTELIEARFLTTAQVAKMIGVCEKKVGQMVRDDGLPVARMVGRERRFDRDAVVAWMRGEDRPALRRVK